jgi:DNA polymerase-3 subunit gamma/tau
VPVVEKASPKSELAGKSVMRYGLKDSNTPGSISEKNKGLPEDKPVLNADFTKEALCEAWIKYADAIDNVHLKSTMHYVQPELKENHLVEIAVLNPEQDHLFKEQGNEIKNFLSEQLKNNQIVLTIKIKENDSDTLPFTDKEKYRYMADKNPNLNKLTKEFNLRLD